MRTPEELLSASRRKVKASHTNTEANATKDVSAAEHFPANISERNWKYLWISTCIAASLALRYCLIGYESDDFRDFLSKWSDFIQEHGRWNALGYHFSDYPPLYLYLLSLSTLIPIPKLYAIKGISILFDYVAAWLVYKLVQHRYPFRLLPVAAGTITLFLPTVLLNSAAWAQCDVIYTCALLGTFYWIIKSKPRLALVIYGLACSLKPQAIFLAPFLAGLLVRRSVPLSAALLPLLVYLLCGFPAILAGRPALEVVFQYFYQQDIPWLSGGAANWHQWLPIDYFGILRKFSIVTAMVASILFILLMQRPIASKQRETWLAGAALLSVLMVPYLLPGMRERYFFAADLFSLIYVFFEPRRWFLAVAIQFASFFAYFPPLFHQEAFTGKALAVVMTAALGLVASDVIRLGFQANGRR